MIYALQPDVTHHTKSSKELESDEIKKKMTDVSLPCAGITAGKTIKPWDEACK
jgi:hypothetical protein